MRDERPSLRQVIRSWFLDAVLLTYRLEGLAKREHVVEMLEWLEASRGATEVREQDLHAFLAAECLEVLAGPKRAIQELQERKRTLGDTPLTSLALADRLAAMGDPRTALPLFEVALGALDLRGVRTPRASGFCSSACGSTGRRQPACRPLRGDRRAGAGGPEENGRSASSRDVRSHGRPTTRCVVNSIISLERPRG